MLYLKFKKQTNEVSATSDPRNRRKAMWKSCWAWPSSTIPLRSWLSIASLTTVLCTDENFQSLCFRAARPAEAGPPRGWGALRSGENCSGHGVLRNLQITWWICGANYMVSIWFMNGWYMVHNSHFIWMKAWWFRTHHWCMVPNAWYIIHMVSIWLMIVSFHGE